MAREAAAPEPPGVPLVRVAVVVSVSVAAAVMCSTYRRPRSTRYVYQHAIHTYFQSVSGRSVQ
eukprot:3171158-Pleurochrysis_carterae.AAC.1